MEELYSYKRFWLNKLENKNEELLSEYDIEILNLKNFEEKENELNNLCEFSFMLDYGVVLRRTKVKKKPIDERLCGDDFRFDENLESALFPFEAVIVLGISIDRKYYYTAGANTMGYALCEDIAVTQSRDIWKWFWKPERFYVVTANTIYADNGLPKLFMGVKIPVDEKGLALVPKLEGSGVLAVEKIEINNTKGLNLGYLEYTAENIINQAFLCLGNGYGWGGDFELRDCSSFICEIYKCFGILIGRNVKNQLKSGVRRLEISNMPKEGKEMLICSLPVGSLLSFDGHTTMFIGDINGKPYIIHALSNILGSYGEKDKVMKVVVTDTDIRRFKNGYTFIESFSDAVLFS